MTSGSFLLELHRSFEGMTSFCMLLQRRGTSLPFSSVSEIRLVCLPSSLALTQRCTHSSANLTSNFPVHVEVAEVVWGRGSLRVNSRGRVHDAEGTSESCRIRSGGPGLESVVCSRVHSGQLLFYSRHLIEELTALNHFVWKDSVIPEIYSNL